MTTTLPIDLVATRAAAERSSTGAAGLRAEASRSEAAGGATPVAFVKFEAMVLQTFMQSILPKDSEAVYGGGLAGDMWKSLLAQQLSEVMAERGGIGIADRILGDHYMQGEQKIPVSGVARGPEKAEADRQDLLSTALIEKLQREVVKSLSDDLPVAAANHAESRFTP